MVTDLRLGQKSKQRGTAIITALLILSLIAIVSSTLLWRQKHSLWRTRNMMVLDALLDATLLTEWQAKQMLSDAIKKSKTEALIVGLDGAWAKLLPKTVHFGITVWGHIEDAASRFNINGLSSDTKTNTQQVSAFKRLLTSNVARTAGAFMPLVSSTQADQVATALVAWLAKRKSFSDGAYLSQVAPRLAYQPAHQPAVFLSELRLVQGMSAAIYRHIESDTMALPGNVAVNVNTASRSVLQAVLNVPTGQLDRLLSIRKESRITQAAQLVGLVTKTAKQAQFVHSLVKVGEVGFGSRYFLVHSHAEQGEQQLSLYSLLHIADDKQVQVIWRSREWA